MNKNNDNYIPWVEKYRPENINDIILEDNNKSLIFNMLRDKIYPNLLLYGPPGTGKTTTIINIINSIYPNEINKTIILHLNASDERGIDMIRNQIQKFIATKPLFNNKIKFIILDEVDYMTKSAQIALKYLLQQYNTTNLVFYLMCNYISKIDESLKNEFIELKFYKTPKIKILDFLQNIVQNEKLSITNESLNEIQEYFDSDIRSMINYMQLNFDNDLTVSMLNNNHMNELHDFILKNDFNTITSFFMKLSIKFNISNKNIIIIYIKYLIYNKIIDYDHSLFSKLESLIHDRNNNCFMNEYFIEIIKQVL
tara:strand:+ start:1748 stop:2680 length:933 start_codon:yes stop_codon:yes gene_type:complete